jgi:hypothetical protein
MTSTQTAPAWPRAQWQDSGEAGFVLWFVFGDFPADFAVDADRYRTRGTPAGIEVVRYRNKALEQWDGYPLAGTLGRVLYDEDSRLFERAKRAGDCVMLRGSLRDRADLDELRDLVGTINALVDAGGVAVVDPQTLSMFNAREWKERFDADDVFVARDHVLILCDEDDLNPGRLHVHTRGLRKFARRDLGIRNVPPASAEHAGQLADHFVLFQTDGGLVEDGHAIEMDGAAATMAVRHAGAVDDPGFNNTHLAMRWPD